MAYTAADGPPALDAVHVWTPASGSAVTLNNKASSPWIKIDNIQGWRSLPDADDNREPLTVGHGEITYDSRYLGKTLVYEGRAMATFRESMHGRINALVQALGASKDEGTMSVTPYTVPGGVAWQYTARVIDFTPNSTWTYGNRYYAYQWGFQFSLRMSDPYFYQAGTPYL